MSGPIWHAGRVDLDALNSLGASSMNAHIGISFTDWGVDWLTARMPVDHRTAQPFGRLHGFVVAIARPEALSRRTSVWTVRICDEEGRLVSISRVTLANIAVSRGAPMEG